MVTVMRKITAVLLSLAVLGLSGCAYDKQHPPYLRNEADIPAFVVIEYIGNDPAASGPLAPNSNAGHAEKGLVISALSVEYDSGRRFNLLKSDLVRIRAAAGHPDIEVWLLSDEGIELAGDDEWERIRTKSHMLRRSP